MSAGDPKPDAGLEFLKTFWNLNACFKQAVSAGDPKPDVGLEFLNTFWNLNVDMDRPILCENMTQIQNIYLFSYAHRQTDIQTNKRKR